MRRAIRARLSRWAIDHRTSEPLLTLESDDGLGRIRRLWVRLGPYVGPNKGLLVALVITSFLAGVAEAGLLYFVVQIAAKLTEASDSLELAVGPFSAQLSLTSSMVAAASCLAVTAALSLVGAIVTARLSTSSLNRARKRLIGAFLDAGWDLQSLERAGHLQELQTTHTTRISLAVLLISNGITAVISFLTLLLSALAIQPIAAGVILLGVLGTGGLLMPLNRMTKRVSTRHKQISAAYASRVAESVDLAREIHAFGVRANVRSAMERRADDVARSHFVTRLLANTTPVIYRIAVLALLLAGLGAVRALDTGNISALGAVVILLVRALSYGQQLSTAFQQASEITPYINELAEQEVAYRSAAMDEGDLDLDDVTAVRFVGVHYTYGSSRDALVDVTFDARPGQVVGIVGPSGGGKSTLVQVLLRLRAPSSGAFLVNEIDATRYTRESWTHRFSLVPQDNHLVLGTVEENIRFFRDGITRDDVVDAATLAHVHDEIAALPDGYDTVIGSGATDLSGGQRQRLGFARALAGRPQVLVLDEPTSALDLQSELLVQQTLDELRGSLTMFIVAHRVTTLTLCDRILVLEDGRVTAFGSYEDVRRQNGFFKDAIELSRLPA